MKWLDKQDELKNLIIVQKKSYEEIGRMYGVSGSYIKKVALKLNIPVTARRKINPCETFDKRPKNKVTCLYCGKEFEKVPSSEGKYCSIECASKDRCRQSIEYWKKNPDFGTGSFTIKGFLRRYIIEKANYKCEKCGWGETNPYTQKVPLQIHHIDGNSLNNKESNLQVLCPNCHALTENFGSRNKNAPNGKSKYYGRK